MPQDAIASLLQRLVRSLLVAMTGGFTVAGLLMSAYAFANLRHAKTIQSQTMKVSQDVERLESSLFLLREELSELRQSLQHLQQP